MRRLAFYTVLATICSVPPLIAKETAPLSLTYKVFEAAVPHVDLENCPASLAADGLFCRATLAHEQLHVFAFAVDGDSPLMGFASFEAEGLPQLLNEPG